jgi:hypothetical protein
MNRTLATGTISELRFQARCVALGIVCAVPVGCERYDLVVRTAGTWMRVQVKTGRLQSGAIIFNTCSNAEGVGRPVSYAGAVDAIGVYSPDCDRCYLLPIECCGPPEGRLRVDPPRNNQSAGVRWADDYAF